MTEWAYRSFRLRVVDKFAEPEFSRLQAKIFFDDYPSIDLRAARSEAERERLAQLRDNLKGRISLRIGAYDGERLIGWTTGYQDAENLFFMANSAVLPDYRRHGIYTQLLTACLRLTKEAGFEAVYSLHLAGNNAVIIPKLKAGFVISGMEMLEWAGTMVRLSYYHNDLRREAYGFRTGLARPSEPLRVLLKY